MSKKARQRHKQKKSDKKLKKKGNVQTIAEQRNYLIKLTKEALHHSLYETVILRGFMRSGIFPFNPESIRKNKLVIHDENLPFPHHQIDTCFDHKRTAIHIDGRVLTSDEVLNSLY